MGDCLMITESTTGIAKPVGVIGGSGHDIINASGTVMAQEDGLQFASGCVEDDAVNGKTIYIEMIRISQANYDTLKANGQLKPGAKYFIYDAQPVAVNASNLPYSSTQSTKQAIDALYDKDRKVVLGGNYMAEAQGTGRIKITQPFYNYQNCTTVTLDKTSNILSSIYGTISAVGLNLSVYSSALQDNGFITIVFEMPSGRSLSSYTELGKGFLLEIPRIIATLS